jgi:hypothetical protein
VRRVPGHDTAKASGISTDPHYIHWGRNSGFQVANLVAHLVGSDGRLLLCGYDFKPGPRGELHHHPDHSGPLKNPDASSLASWARLFVPAAPQFKELGIEVINCSPGSALTCFPTARLEDVL